MGKKTPSKGSGEKKKPRGDPNMGLLREDFEDEVDEFHKTRDILPLSIDDDYGDSDDENIDEAVMNLQSSDDEDDEEAEEDEGGEEHSAGEEDEEELSGLVAKMKKQARLMKQKAGGAKEFDSDEDEEEEDGEGEDALWGKKKRAYYSADNVDFEIQSDDEAMLEEEEVEAVRLQKKLAAKLRPEDYEQEEEEEGEDEDDEELSLDEAVRRAESGRKAKRGTGKEDASEGGAVSVEEVAKEVDAMSQEEKMEALMREAPELVELLSDLKSSLHEFHARVKPLWEAARSGSFAASSRGLSYLQVKHQLLLHYCSCIVFYLLLRAEGRAVKGHPVVDRLVEMRLYLEKIRPIDKKLQYQIDKLLRAAATSDSAGGEGEEGAGEDDLSLRPRPHQLVSKLQEEEEEEGASKSQVYRPPKIAPAAMEGEEGAGGGGIGGEWDTRDLDGPEKGGKLGREQRKEKEQRRKAMRSAFVRELAEEMEGRPEEVAAVGASSAGPDSQAMQREIARLSARARTEEDMFGRVPLSRDERKRLRALQRNSKSGTGSLAGMLDDFEDDVAGLVDADNIMGNVDPSSSSQLPPHPLLDAKRKLSQVIAEAGKARMTPLPLPSSGDSDLPVRNDLGERRRMFESSQLSRSLKNRDEEEEEEEEEEGGGRGRGVVEFDDEDRGDEEEQDEFYQEAVRLRDDKAAAKRAKFGREDAAPFAEDEPADGKRTINYEMETNRGLTPHRKKLTKNPRKKYKLAHAKAVVRRKGQVRDMRKDGGSYGGEATGIKSGISRSVRIRG